jgi:enamine deaminase RidA (YjgF/YER057c/UK114 family)
VPAVASQGLLFVSGQDPARGGRLAYRGRVGDGLSLADGKAAARLATLNALAAATVAVGSLARVRRCIALTCFVDGAPGAVSRRLVGDALALLRLAFPGAPPPVVWLRPAHGLAGGMPVEVELVLELNSEGASTAPSETSPRKRLRGQSPRSERTSGRRR